MAIHLRYFKRQFGGLRSFLLRKKQHLTPFSYRTANGKIILGDVSYPLTIEVWMWVIVGSRCFIIRALVVELYRSVMLSPFLPSYGARIETPYTYLMFYSYCDIHIIWSYVQSPTWHRCHGSSPTALHDPIEPSASWRYLHKRPLQHTLYLSS